MFHKFNLTFTTIILALSLLCKSEFAKAAECGFSISPYKVASYSSNRIPLFVEGSQFTSQTVQFFKKAQQRAYEKLKKSIEFGPRKCANAHIQVNQLVQKLLKGSNLESLVKKSLSPLEVVVLCSKSQMPPIAKIIAGKYILAPMSLVEKSKTPAAMAVVLAHEIAHFTLHHHARLYEQLHSDLSTNLSKHQKIVDIKSKHEKEADMVSLQLLANAGYDPLSSLQHLKQVHLSRKPSSDGQTLSSSQKKATHQKLDERILFLSQQIQRCRYSAPTDS